MGNFGFPSIPSDTKGEDELIKTILLLFQLPSKKVKVMNFQVCCKIGFYRMNAHKDFKKYKFCVTYHDIAYIVYHDMCNGMICACATLHCYRVTIEEKKPPFLFRQNTQSSISCVFHRP